MRLTTGRVTGVLRRMERALLGGSLARVVSIGGTITARRWRLPTVAIAAPAAATAATTAATALSTFAGGTIAVFARVLTRAGCGGACAAFGRDTASGRARGGLLLTTFLLALALTLTIALAIELPLSFPLCVALAILLARSGFLIHLLAVHLLAVHLLALRITRAVAIAIATVPASFFLAPSILVAMTITVLVALPVAIAAMAAARVAATIMTMLPITISVAATVPVARPFASATFPGGSRRLGALRRLAGE